MLSKLIAPGSRVEISRMKNTDSSQSILISKVYDILSEERLEITMPIEKSKIVLLALDEECDLVLNSKGGGLYQCFAKVIDRYKSGNVYLLVMELSGSLRKFQRREFYRHNCSMPMDVRVLDEEEQILFEKSEIYDLKPGVSFTKGVAVDISGGGLRFLSTQIYQPGCLLYCSFSLMTPGGSRKLAVVGRLLSIRALENRPGATEHRIQYEGLDNDTREEIIKFIFEEERKSRKIEKHSKAKS